MTDVSRFHPKVQGRALGVDGCPMPPGRGRGGRGARVQSDDPFDFDTIETSKGPAQAEPADEEIADEENGEGDAFDQGGHAIAASKTSIHGVDALEKAVGHFG